MHPDRDAGRLIYVVGPSGAGKDAVIACAKEKLNKIRYLYFSPRYVTRPGGDHSGELFIASDTFTHYRLNGHFALHWQAHGLHYGVSVVIDRQLRAGRTVVVNGSRANVSTALGRYPAMTVVHITVPAQVARARLLARGRECAPDIAQRLARAPALNVPPGQLVHIDNRGALEEATSVFVRVLTRDHEARFGWLYHAAIQ